GTGEEDDDPQHAGGHDQAGATTTATTPGATGGLGPVRTGQEVDPGQGVVPGAVGAGQSSIPRRRAERAR
ncbi:MAG TPA: hypothetical protein VGD11_14400, partial [Mycobacteriales bacterium]